MKQFLQDLAPPLLWRFLHELASRPKSRDWEYVPEGWRYADLHPSKVKGWNVESVLEVYKQKWPRFVAMIQGTTPIAFSHESALTGKTDLINHNTAMSFAYCAALAAQNVSTFSMLDWGGGIGHYYVLAQALLPHVEIEYHCKDMPLLTEYGAQLFPAQHFCADETCLDRTYDFVMASTSLHYSEDWSGLLAGLANATHGYLYITGLPTVSRVPSFVFVQRPYSYGYETEYLGWCLNLEEFLKCAEAIGLTLVREFVVGHRPLICSAPEQNEYRGFLFHSSSVVS
jgi:putative methyltransferase (TIGR04325 family)